MNYAVLLQSALVALLRNKMRSMLTVLGITIGIAAVICVVAIGKAGQAQVEQQLNNLGDNFVWIEAGGRAVNGVRTGTHGTKTLTYADAVATYLTLSIGKFAENASSLCSVMRNRFRHLTVVTKIAKLF